MIQAPAPSLPNQQKTTEILLRLLVILIPAGYVLYLALHSGQIPSSDYWGILEKVFSIQGFSNRWGDWLNNQNGHLVLIPRAIYALNIFITHGSNTGLTLLTWIFALIQAILLTRLLPLDIQQSWLIIFLICCISIFTFTPSAAHTWIMGFSGVAWVGANLFSIASITCLIFYLNGRGIWGIIGSLLFALAAIFTYGTSLVLWIVLCVGVGLTRPRLWPGLLYIGFTLIVYHKYFSMISPPAVSANSGSIYERLSAFSLFVATYMGAIFTTQPIIATLLGLGGLIASVVVYSLMLWQNPVEVRLSVLPWLLLQLYALGNAATTALNRGQESLEPALTSRYTTISGLFWIGLIVTVLYGLSRNEANLSWSKFGPALIIITLLIVSMYQVGLPLAQNLLRRTSTEALVVLSLNLDMPDGEAVRHAITPSVSQFFNLIPTLRKYQHVPFHHQLDNFCGQLNQAISKDILKPAPQARVQGRFDFMDRFNDNDTRVVGWSYYPDQPLQCIVLLNEDYLIRGLALSGFDRPDIAEALNLPNSTVGWVGYARPSSFDERLTAYVRFVGNEQWFALPGSHSTADPGQVNLTVYSTILGLN